MSAVTRCMNDVTNLSKQLQIPDVEFDQAVDGIRAVAQTTVANIAGDDFARIVMRDGVTVAEIVSAAKAEPAFKSVDFDKWAMLGRFQAHSYKPKMPSIQK